MSVPLALGGMDALALAQEGERLCRENNMKAGIKYLEMALQKRVDLGGRSLEAVSAIYSQLGNAYFVLRLYDKALEYHQLDLDTASLLSDQSGLAKAHGNLSNTYKAIGDFDSAYDHATAHLRIAQEIGDKECEARALFNLACVYHCRAKTLIQHSGPSDDSGLLTSTNMNVTSQLREAINCYLQNLCIVESLNDLPACGRTYGNIGNSYYMLGDYSTAVLYHNKRLKIARQFGDRSAMKRAYTNLGNAHIFLSETEIAKDYYIRALSIAIDLHDETAEAQCCFNVGNGAAISGDHFSAAEYHTRYLKLTRKMTDGKGEAQACATLANDYRNRNEHGRAIYFLVLQGLVSMKMGDHAGVSGARGSLKDLLKSLNKWPVKDTSVVEVDASGDPEPRSLSEVKASLQSLVCESEVNSDGLLRVSLSTSTNAEEQPLRQTSVDDDFFEMVSRAQSKRLNDQRCDPKILSDLTNHSKNIARQSDTIVCNSGKKHRFKRPHLSSLLGRVGRVVKRPSGLRSSFIPASTSTPQLPSRRHGNSNVMANQTPYVVTEFSVTSDNTLELSKVSIIADVNTTRMMNASPDFRFPVAPPRNRNRGDRMSTMTCTSATKNGAEGMLDLIANLQGRRMEEQRAHLSVHAETVSLSGADSEEAKDEATNCDNSPYLSNRRRTERSHSEDAGSLYEMVIRSQSDRIDEQRSELPRSIPAEDVTQLVYSMQKGRIETQRANLSTSPY